VHRHRGTVRHPTVLPTGPERGVLAFGQVVPVVTADPEAHRRSARRRDQQQVRLGTLEHRNARAPLRERTECLDATLADPGPVPPRDRLVNLQHRGVFAVAAWYEPVVAGSERRRHLAVREADPGVTARPANVVHRPAVGEQSTLLPVEAAVPTEEHVEEALLAVDGPGLPERLARLVVLLRQPRRRPVRLVAVARERHLLDPTAEPDLERGHHHAVR
jgi:hypothetical protein